MRYVLAALTAALVAGFASLVIVDGGTPASIVAASIKLTAPFVGSGDSSARPGHSSEALREAQDVKTLGHQAQTALPSKPARAISVVGLPIPPGRPIRSAADAKNAKQRTRFSARHTPRFGPRLFGVSATSEQVFNLERRYYEEHPDEYDRFVALWGDLHALR